MVGEENRSFKRKRGATSVYYFFRGDFPDVEFFVAWSYVHLMEESLVEIIFGPPELLDYDRAFMELIDGLEAENIIIRSEEEVKITALTSGKNYDSDGR